MIVNTFPNFESVRKMGKTSLDCTEFGFAFWMILFCSTTIHEFGHVMAHLLYRGSIHEFGIGVGVDHHKGKGKFVWERSFFRSQIRVRINPLKPWIGFVVAKHVEKLSSRQLLFMAASGPLFQAVTLAGPYSFTKKYIVEHQNDPKYSVRPFVWGTFFGCGAGILFAMLNLLPMGKGSDGRLIAKNLYAIYKQK